ncbi:flagellar basal body-associated protein FliL, partial [Mesorhizobium sp. M7A.F.Ca.CA.004.12.1.1]
MANIEQVQPRKGPSPAIQAGLLLLVTAAAIGMGWMAGEGPLRG